MHMICLCGMPAVGKMTVAECLCRRTNYKNFHNHLVVDALLAVFEFGSVPFVQLREKIWLEIMSRAAQECVEGLVFTFAFDRTVSSDFLNLVEATMFEFGGRISLVELTCERLELERRLLAPSRAGHGKLKDLDFFKRLEADDAFPRPALPVDTLVLDTTRSPAEATARRIVEVLGLHPESG